MSLNYVRSKTNLSRLFGLIDDKGRIDRIDRILLIIRVRVTGYTRTLSSHTYATGRLCGGLLYGSSIH